MDANFWHQKWATKEIGFHQPQAHPLLVKHLQQLQLKPGARIFLPLCGKTLDIHWLLSQGFQVAGAELSELAIKELFIELDIAPQITQLGKITRYSAPKLDIFVGNIFALSREQLGQVDAIYDRAALVALPETMRNDYAEHLVAISHRARQLLISFEYDQSKLQVPPFSVCPQAVSQLYSKHYELQLLTTQALDSPFKGQVDAVEHVWHLN